MRVLVCGGRNFEKRSLLFAALDKIEKERGNITVVIHGDARGADRMAGEWAKSWGKRVLKFPAHWQDLSHPDRRVKQANGNVYDANAGMRRNIKMVEEGKPDLVIAFPGGAGTANMVKLAEQVGLEVIKGLQGE